MEQTLKIGDVRMTAGKGSFICYGLGSCVGLFIQDRKTGMAAGAHIFLPDNEQGEEPEQINVSTAIRNMLDDLASNGSCLTMLRAKVAGGANVVGLHVNTGEQNVQSVIRHLVDRKIFIAARDVGGTTTRTVRFDNETGLLTVKKRENNEIEFY